VLSVFISCNDDDDDDHHPDPNLACISPFFKDAFLRNPASGVAGPNDFVAGTW
jgi:hypothetical protein